MTRVAAVDCGTNTVKLLVADLDPATGSQETLVREMRIVRLGQDVDRTGRLADEALARLFAAVEEYAAIVAAHDVDALRFVATSAVRDAGNVDVFARGDPAAARRRARGGLRRRGGRAHLRRRDPHPADVTGRRSRCSTSAAARPS